MWMKRIVVLGLALGVSGMAFGAEWEAKKAPLMTRWAKDVKAESVLAEYPRPQMVREKWLNLNGVWEFGEAKEGEKAPAGKALEGRVLVPFPLESALSGVMKHYERVWYRRTFKVPSDWEGQRVLLHFGAVDWGCSVYVNGKRVGLHRGGYDPFTFDVTDKLKKGEGEQEIVLTVWDPADFGDQPRGKQVREPRGIWYTPSTGIWQTVWVEPVPQAYVKGVKIVPDVEKGEVAVKVDADGPLGGQIAVQVMDEGQVVAEGSGLDVRLKVPDAKLWSPDSPHLYDVVVKVGNDQVKSYFGMRTVEVGKDEKGVTRILLNGKAVFEVGMLDQGFWPDGLYTAPTDEALKFDIEQQKKLGFNLIRKHVKVEPQRWYYWCDKLGMLVWQDMPSANNKTEESKKQYEAELTRLIETHWNHPSIIMWVVFNEGWGQYETPRVTELAKKLDPTRLVNNASGWTDAGAGDVIDMHSYPGPGSPKPEEKRAAVLGEFGGLGLPVEGHQWWERKFSYSEQGSKEELLSQYTRLLSKAWQLRKSAGLSAIIYTQTTDVEGEINGLMTYDRELKADEAALRKANLGRGPAVESRVVVPTGGGEWRYVTEKPAAGWMKEGFSDAAWKAGAGGFGSPDTTSGTVGTKWETEEIWMRREVELKEGDLKDLVFLANHDDSMELWVNGVPARTRRHAVSVYEEQPLSKEAQKTLKAGKNLIAVHAKNTGGPGFIDVGMVQLVETDRTAAGGKRKD